MTDIQIKYWDFMEGRRHNLAYEGETNRHNVVSEGQGQQNLIEMNRHNETTEQQGSQGIAENIRHNKANEALSSYANQSGRLQALASGAMAAASESQARSAAARANSDIRLNAAREAGLDYDNSLKSATLVSNAAKTNVSNYVGMVSEPLSFVKDVGGLIAMFAK